MTVSSQHTTPVAGYPMVTSNYSVDGDLLCSELTDLFQAIDPTRLVQVPVDFRCDASGLLMDGQECILTNFQQSTSLLVVVFRKPFMGQVESFY